MKMIDNRWIFDRWESGQFQYEHGDHFTLKTNGFSIDPSDVVVVFATIVHLREVIFESVLLVMNARKEEEKNK